VLERRSSKKSRQFNEINAIIAVGEKPSQREKTSHRKTSRVETSEKKER
jgi:hypothetical protein